VGPPDEATILFGDPDAASLGKCKGQGGKNGTPCGDRDHDESQEAAEKLVPRNVTISVDGTVNFEIGGVHQAAIFPAGTKPEDVVLGGGVGFGGCPGGPAGSLYIDDANAIDVLANPQCGGGSTTPSTAAATFDTPGKYLVICTFIPHFTGRDMYGWVTVK
jgi:plastocyanin